MKIRTLLKKTLRAIIFLILSNSFTNVAAQTLIFHSDAALFATEEEESDKVSMRYEHSYKINDNFILESDLGRDQYNNSSGNRMHVRSHLRYFASDHFKIGGGMGFFWKRLNQKPSNELRFSQDVEYFTGHDYGVFSLKVAFEEQIFQSNIAPNPLLVRSRVRAGYKIPFSEEFYVGMYNELFINLLGNSENLEKSRLQANRIGATAGYNYSENGTIEAQLIRESDLTFGTKTAAWTLQASVIHSF